MPKLKSLIQKYWYYLIIVFFMIIAALWYRKSNFNFFEELNANIFSEFLGILFTIIIIDRLNIVRANQQEKLRLISQMASPDNSIAVDAIRLLRLRKWLTDGTLENKDFSYGDYEKANLGYAKLNNSSFTYANLKDANLCQAELSNSELHETILENTLFHNANLKGAKIGSTDFETYNIKNADFYLANLSDVTFLAKISGKITENHDDILRYSKRLELAVMPDGKKYNGKYKLKMDIKNANARGFNISDPNDMAIFYEVSIEDYNEGQIWFNDSGIDRSPIAFV